MRSLLLILALVAVFRLGLAQNYKSLMVDPKKDYSFKNEGKVINWGDSHATINSNMLVNNETLTDIKFTRASLRGDTLNIELYQTDESHDHHYKIQIVNNKYAIDYNFSYPADTLDRKIQALEYRLILNANKFKYGSTIKGYTEFKGKCLYNCYHDIITAKGYFNVTIE